MPTVSETARMGQGAGSFGNIWPQIERRFPKSPASACPQAVLETRAAPQSPCFPKQSAPTTAPSADKRRFRFRQYAFAGKRAVSLSGGIWSIFVYFFDSWKDCIQSILAVLARRKVTDVEEDGVVEIDLAELFRKNIVLLIVATIVVGAIAFGASYIIPNEYTSSTSMYVLIHGQREQKNQDKTSLSTTDLRTAQMVASDVTVILKSNRVATDVAQRLGIGSLSGYKVNVTSGTDTRVITLSVTGKNPELTTQVANAIVDDATIVSAEVMGTQAISVVDEASVPLAPSGPNHRMIGLAGAAAGFVLALVAAALRSAMDTRVRDGEQASQIVGVPVVGHFPAVA